VINSSEQSHDATLVMDDKVLCGIEAFAPPIPSDAPPQYREFWRLWREQKYFECHEILEELWRHTRGPQKLFYNGLIHGAVAIYQHRRGNAIGAARQFLRARIKLEALEPKYFEVDVEAFLSRIESEIAGSLTRIEAGERASWPALERSIRRRIAREMNEG